MTTLRAGTQKKQWRRKKQKRRIEEKRKHVFPHLRLPGRRCWSLSDGLRGRAGQLKQGVDGGTGG